METNIKCNLKHLKANWVSILIKWLGELRLPINWVNWRWTTVFISINLFFKFWKLTLSDPQRKNRSSKLRLIPTSELQLLSDYRNQKPLVSPNFELVCGTANNGNSHYISLYSFLYIFNNAFQKVMMMGFVMKTQV